MSQAPILNASSLTIIITDNTAVFNNCNGWTVYDDSAVMEKIGMNWQTTDIVAVSLHFNLLLP